MMLGVHTEKGIEILRSTNPCTLRCPTQEGFLRTLKSKLPGQDDWVFIPSPEPIPVGSDNSTALLPLPYRRTSESLSDFSLTYVVDTTYISSPNKMALPPLDEVDNSVDISDDELKFDYLFEEGREVGEGAEGDSDWSTEYSEEGFV